MCTSWKEERLCVSLCLRWRRVGLVRWRGDSRPGVAVSNASFNMDAPSLNWQQEVIVGLAGSLVQVTCTWPPPEAAPSRSTAALPGRRTRRTSHNFGGDGYRWQSIDVSSATCTTTRRTVRSGVHGRRHRLVARRQLLAAGRAVPGTNWLNGGIHSDGHGISLPHVRPGRPPGLFALCALLRRR